MVLFVAAQNGQELNSSVYTVFQATYSNPLFLISVRDK